MRPDTYLGVAAQPGLGLGWTRVASAVAQRIAPGAIERIWLFAPVRRDEREWGTAVVAGRSDGERWRIFTASYLIAIRGRTRGQGKVAVEEVGESPLDVIHEVIAGVMDRAGETEHPVEIDPALWFASDDQHVHEPQPHNEASPGFLDQPHGHGRASVNDDLNEAAVS